VLGIYARKERRKSGEEIVDEMRVEEEEKREFYLNIAKWVDEVSVLQYLQELDCPTIFYKKFLLHPTFQPNVYPR